MTERRLAEFDAPKDARTLDFVDGVLAALKKRSSSLKHHGKVTFEIDGDFDAKWCQIFFEDLGRDFVTVEVSDEPAVSVYVRSVAVKNRGLYCYRREDVAVVPDAAKVAVAVDEVFCSRDFRHRRDPDATYEVDAVLDSIACGRDAAWSDAADSEATVGW